MPGPRLGTTLVVGCTVRQMLTDQYTNGTFAMPNSATAADSVSDPGPPYFRSSRNATKMSHITSVMVSRASHCHHTPHALRAQMGPETRTMRPNRTVNSAAATATRSAPGLRPKRKMALAMPHTNAETNIVIAVGT